ncbi:hypothetical protein [Tropicimonas isoalkanivorans]|uniref:Hemolysin-type calcium-binding repeat-containing protein n=1 Tax=Tropicimonas isoalkanivorans TaxID=441112 RepID=A0A1I1E1G0_9RHOB|nr:hypothetical protein [Tropicimonas isoalkanivorans]SFB79058.1 Hemolysin-type calcium-binding repeat-containing protein [Tropicimonas isoalkanivorans]
MIRWKYYNANLGIFAFRWDTDHYDVTVRKDRIVLTYDEGLGKSFEAHRNAYRIVLETADAKTFVPAEGPEKGERQFTDGTVSEIRMYGKAGELQVRATGVDVPLVALQGWYNEDGDYDSLFQYLDGFNSTHIGANNGPRSGWNDYILKDEIRTGAGNDKVWARGGNDYIVDHGGRDVYHGGAGRDQLSYDQWFWEPAGIKSGIRADLAGGTIQGPDGRTDKVTAIEQIRGTFLRDVIRGDAKDNEFQGMAGDDLLVGRGGWDRASYRNEANQGGTAGIRANLETGKVRDGFGTVDTLRGIEEVQGTDVRDVFTDGKRDHSYRGRDGNDLFRITGGDDWIRGDSGADRFLFKGRAFGSNTIDDFDTREGDRIEIAAAKNFKALTIASVNGGEDTLVTFAKGEILLEDVASVDTGDFIF